MQRVLTQMFLQKLKLAAALSLPVVLVGGTLMLAPAASEPVKAAQSKRAGNAEARFRSRRLASLLDPLNPTRSLLAHTRFDKPLLGAASLRPLSSWTTSD
jgi:hypothetical protein